MKWIVNPISINPITPQDIWFPICMPNEVGGMPPCELDGPPPGGGGGHCRVVMVE